VPDIDWPARARALAPHFAARAGQHDRDASFPIENFDALREAGFLKLTVPRRLGGYEESLATFLTVQEELARGDGSTALILNMHVLRIGLERENPSYPPEWFGEICRGAVEHGWLVNTAATEEGLGSPAGGGLPDTSAEPIGGGWLLNGRKTFTTGGAALRYVVVLARLPGDGDTPRLGNFMVLNDDPGVSFAPAWDALGMRASASDDLVLENVRLTGDRLLRSWRIGEPQAGGRGPWFPLGVAATTLGVARAARDYAVGYARTRTPNSARTIKDYPGVRSKIARIDLLLHRSRALIDDAARAWERRAEPTPPGTLAPGDRVAVAKVDTMNNCIEAVDLAMRIVGGVSLSRHRPIERYYRDVRVCLHNPPLEDRALEQLAHAALDTES
jgi:alkylation response protein AidB-like acyl-CoA dehydrogenase